MSSPELEDLDRLRAGNEALRREIDQLASTAGTASPFARGLRAGLLTSALVIGLSAAVVVFVLVTSGF